MKNGLLICMLDASVGWNTSCLSDGCQKLVGVRCTVSNVIVMVGENQVLFLFGLVAEASVLIGENQVLFLFWAGN